MSTTRTRAHLRTAAALALIAAAVATEPAHAAGLTSAACSAQFKATITPGFTTTAGSGAATTGGQTGAVACTGTLDGHRVTGPGSIGFDETYTNGDCSSDSTTGMMRMTIPTTAGAQHLVGAFTTKRTALAFAVDLRFPGSTYSGIGVIVPLSGSCLLTPLREVAITATGTLRAA